MPTAAIAARSGIIGLSTGATAGSADAIAELRNIQLRAHRDLIDATSNDSSGFAEFIQGTASWNFTAEALYVPSSANVQFLARNAWSSGSSMAFIFMPSTAASGTYVFTGTGLIEDWDLGGEQSGAFAINISGRGTGGLTFSTST